MSPEPEGLPRGASERLCSAAGSRPAKLAALLLLFVVACSFAVGERSVAAAEDYSAYSDPGKTALAVILSEEENVREFRDAFGLDDGEMGRVLAAVREENGKVAKEFAQSERIVAANRSLPDARVAAKISASDYEETVEEAIARTKDRVAGLLPAGSEPELASWVDAQWRAEASAASAGAARGDFARTVQGKAGRRVVCKVYATQYVGYTRYEAALPHRTLKFGSRPRVVIKRVNGNKAVQPRVKEVGPWNTRDNYWQASRNRTMWKRLERCVPESFAAYYKDFNGGKDEFGRRVLNPAGADITPAVARRMGLGRYQSAWVYVKFPWLRR